MEKVELRWTRNFRVGNQPIIDKAGVLFAEEQSPATDSRTAKSQRGMMVDSEANPYAAPPSGMQDDPIPELRERELKFGAILRRWELFRLGYNVILGGVVLLQAAIVALDFSSISSSGLWGSWRLWV